MRSLSTSGFASAKAVALQEMGTKFQTLFKKAGAMTMCLGAGSIMYPWQIEDAELFGP